jgi:hypothetical protein
MGIGLTRDEYDDEQDEWKERVYRIAKAVNEAVRLPDRLNANDKFLDREFPTRIDLRRRREPDLDELIASNWDE